MRHERETQDDGMIDKLGKAAVNTAMNQLKIKKRIKDRAVQKAADLIVGYQSDTDG